MCRRSSAVQEAHKLEVMVKVLEIDLKGADLVQREMDKLVLELENGRRKIINSAEAALARNPVWTSGFLDGQFQNFSNSRHLQPRASGVIRNIKARSIASDFMKMSLEGLILQSSL